MVNSPESIDATRGIEICEWNANNPEGVKVEVCWACSNTTGCEEEVLKSRRNRNDRNPIVESKGVYREIGSEGS